MATAKVGDINIYYEVHGEGEPLVLISGYASSSAVWTLSTPIFSKEYRVVVFDNRGTGRSDKPDIPYTMDMMADDVVGLLDTIDIDAAHICGMSLGGFIALRHPQRVISLVLACTNCGGTHQIAADAEVVERVFDLERAQKLTPEENLRVMFPFMCSQQFIDNNPDIIDQLAAKSTEYPTPLHGSIRQREAIASHDTYDRLPEINAPTLVISGDADTIVPVENSKLLADRIPDAELVIVGNMGHLFTLEAADEFHKTVLDFIKRHPRSGSTKS
jgi:pimeloyl-ACP methyl ester carboxylesterase